MTEQAIKRGLLQSFDPGSYTGDVLILEATSYVLEDVPIATSIDGTSGIAGASCAVLFFDAQNQTDAVIIAVYGVVPSPTPGRVTFCTPIQEINAASITSGSTSTFTMSSLPAGALGIIGRFILSSGTSGANITIAPHGGTIADYGQVGAVTTVALAGMAIIPIDSNAQIDIKANSGNCTVTLWVYGYIF